MVVLGLLVAAVALAWPLASSLRGSHRERDRRLRYVARHPEQVNTGDICRLLARELGRDEVALIIDRAERLGVRPWTMLSWIQRYDVHTLAVVVAAELSHEELLLHLGNGTLPDLAELEVFAAINGLSAECGTPARPPVSRPALAAPATAPAAGSSVVAESGPVSSRMPQIVEPGSWPYDQFADLPEWPTWPDEPPAEPGPLAA
jgi:hypothetical protein